MCARFWPKNPVIYNITILRVVPPTFVVTLGEDKYNVKRTESS